MRTHFCTSRKHTNDELGLRYMHAAFQNIGCCRMAHHAPAQRSLSPDHALPHTPTKRLRTPLSVFAPPEPTSPFAHAATTGNNDEDSLAAAALMSMFANSSGDGKSPSADPLANGSGIGEDEKSPARRCRARQPSSLKVSLQMGLEQNGN